MSRHHIVISGTGRAGTTFLVQLLTELKLDTGFTDMNTGIFANSNAGMELDLRQPDAPYIVKSPWLCDTLDDILSTEDIVIDYAVIPMRDLYSAAQSRIDVSQRSNRNEFGESGDIPGGLWHTSNPSEQEGILAQQLYKLLYTIVKYDIRMIMLLFPKLLKEPKYLYEKIKPILGDVSYENFALAFNKVSHPELVHNFRDNNT